MMGKFKDRVRELRRVRAGELRPNPKNWRLHPQAQRDALQAVLAEVGFADALLARELPDGSLELCDGHLRRDIDPGAEVPVLVLDLTEEEADKLLLTLDPLAGMSATDKGKLEDLVAEVEMESGPLRKMIGELAESARTPFTAAVAFLDDLKFHPRNYRKHPDDQLEHLMASIREHGFYRNVVVARDNTVLAGQGVVQAARKMGKASIPVVRLDIEPDEPRAWKVLTSDNEISRLAEVDDRALTELLKELVSLNPKELLGTGFNPQQLAALAMVTRPASEIADKNEAAEWLGMPEYDEGIRQFKLVVTFQTEEDRRTFVDEAELKIDKVVGKT